MEEEEGRRWKNKKSERGMRGKGTSTGVRRNAFCHIELNLLISHIFLHFIYPFIFDTNSFNRRNKLRLSNVKIGS